MKNKKSVSEFLSSIAKDIVDKNIHGYGKKNYVLVHVDKKIKNHITGQLVVQPINPWG